MLDILKGHELVNCLVVVTRYFGGILLGTGGLVRAYSGALNIAIDDSEKFDVEYGNELEIIVDYKNMEFLSYYCKINNIRIVNKEYGENIKIVVEVSDKKMDEIINEEVNKSFKIQQCRNLSKKLIRKNH